jgi:hypothetical protein
MFNLEIKIMLRRNISMQFDYPTWRNQRDAYGEKS